MKKNLSIILAVAAILAVVLTAGCVTTDSPQNTDGMVTITDAFGRDLYGASTVHKCFFLLLDLL